MEDLDGQPAQQLAQPGPGGKGKKLMHTSGQGVPQSQVQQGRPQASQQYQQQQPQVQMTVQSQTARPDLSRYPAGTVVGNPEVMDQFPSTSQQTMNVSVAPQVCSGRIRE